MLHTRSQPASWPGTDLTMAVLSVSERDDSQPVLCHREVITVALGGELEFEFFHRWFNSLFLTSACLTMLLFHWQYRTSINEAGEQQGLPLYSKQ